MKLIQYSGLKKLINFEINYAKQNTHLVNSTKQIPSLKLMESHSNKNNNSSLFSFCKYLTSVLLIWGLFQPFLTGEACSIHSFVCSAASAGVRLKLSTLLRPGWRYFKWNNGTTSKQYIFCKYIEWCLLLEPTTIL